MNDRREKRKAAASSASKVIPVIRRLLWPASLLRAAQEYPGRALFAVVWIVFFAGSGFFWALMGPWMPFAIFAIIHFVPLALYLLGKDLETDPLGNRQ